jgi:hypothetical protein
MVYLQLWKSSPWWEASPWATVITIDSQDTSVLMILMISMTRKLIPLYTKYIVSFLAQHCLRLGLRPKKIILASVTGRDHDISRHRYLSFILPKNGE